MEIKYKEKVEGKKIKNILKVNKLFLFVSSNLFTYFNISI